VSFTAFSARASGKVILLGEHAVVYGAPALAAGIERGARAEAERLEDGATSTLRLGDNELRAATTGDDLARAFGALLAEGDPLPAMAVTAAIDLPPGAGLGASAALGVAIARAALAAAGRPASDADAIARATAWERVFHGNPSGVDVTAAAIGGCFRFTRGAAAEAGLGARSIVPAQDLVLCVGLTGISTSTREMVEGLARLRAHKPEMVDRSIAGIGALVENAALAVEAGDLPGLGQLMDLNQMLLAGLMLSTEMLEDLCSRARAAGALGAKLTGKGGGGSVLALAADVERADLVLAAWREAGYQGFVTRVSSRTFA
jgi:mevalonate kinase